MKAKADPMLSQTDLFKVEATKQPPPPWIPAEGRDELNLAEFPLAALSNRIAPSQKTLVFKDSVYDAHARARVERQLTITGTEKYGLPNAVDDEVILALIQLSKRQGFTSKTVPFSRYEIIQILGWQDESWNYRRILQALDRWTSVTLKYENAWWDPTSKAWADETFHIIERLTEIKDQNGKERAAFVWSDVIFQNLENGHLKTLDLGLYRRLKIPTAKRLYRLLDKRFYRRRKVEFDLVELAFHKLGVSQNYLIGNIKQRLQPAIEELEKVGFIKLMPRRERYRKHGVGEWNVIFEKGDGSQEAAPAEADVTSNSEGPASEVEAQLIELGVSPLKARRLVTTHPEGHLCEKIDIVRYLKARGDATIKNPAGYLVKSIEDQYVAPDGYQTPGQRDATQEKIRQRAAKRQKTEQDRHEREQWKKDAAEGVAREGSKRVDDYLASLTPEGRDEVTAAAIKREVEAGHRWLVERKGKTGEVYRRIALEAYVQSLLENKLA